MSQVLPLGPYNPTLQQPVYVKLYNVGDLIEDSEIYLGYNHRGIEKLAENKNYIESISLVERICGITSYSHGLAYCLAIENINKIEVPKRANYLRVIFSELERIQSHYLRLALTSNIMNFHPLFMMNLGIRDTILDTLKNITGNRVMYSMNIIGGVRRDITEESKIILIKLLDAIKKENRTIKNIFSTDTSILKRTENIGVLTKEDAEVYGTTGPCGRGSAAKLDSRKISNYNCYDEFQFDVPSLEKGDVHSRLMIKIMEIEESLKIIEQALHNLPIGNINNGLNIHGIKEGRSLTLIESPTGTLSYFVKTNEEDNKQRISIHGATFKNVSILGKILKNNSVADAGLIINSIDPDFACMDR